MVPGLACPPAKVTQLAQEALGCARSSRKQRRWQTSIRPATRTVLGSWGGTDRRTVGRTDNQGTAQIPAPAASEAGGGSTHTALSRQVAISHGGRRSLHPPEPPAPLPPAPRGSGVAGFYGDGGPRQLPAAPRPSPTPAARSPSRTPAPPPSPRAGIMLPT